MSNSFTYEDFSLLNYFPGMVGYLDTRHRIVALNKQAISLLGFKSLDFAVGKTSFDIPSRAAECADQYISQDKLVLDQEKPLQILDICEYSDNSLHAWLTTKSLVKDNCGVKLGILYVAQEIKLHNLDFVVDERFGNVQKPRAFSCWIDDGHAVSQLSKRQKECLFYLIRGKSCRTIADILGISQRTVETHLDEIKSKFSCCTKSDVIEKAIDEGMLNSIPKSLLKGGLSSQFDNQLKLHFSSVKYTDK